MTRQRLARYSVVAALMLAAVTAFASSTASAQRLFASFTGAWNVTVQGPQGPMNSLLTLKQSGDTVSGQFESELGTAAVTGMTKGDSIKFSFSLDAGGQALSLQATAALKDADNLAGVIEAAGMGAFPFSATRKP